MVKLSDGLTVLTTGAGLGAGRPLSRRGIRAIRALPTVPTGRPLSRLGIFFITGRPLSRLGILVAFFLPGLSRPDMLSAVVRRGPPCHLAVFAVMFLEQESWMSQAGLAYT